MHLLKHLTLNPYSRQNDIRFIQPLLKFGYLLGVSPYYNFHEDGFVHLGLYRIYVVVLLITMSVLSGCSMFGRMLHELQTVVATVPVLGLFRFVIYLVLTCVTYLRTTFWKSMNLRLMLKKLLLFDLELQKRQRNNRKFNKIYLQLIGILTFNVILCSTDWYAFYNANYISFYFFENIQSTLVYILSVFIINLLLCFEDRFRNLNEQLQNTLDANFSGSEMSVDKIGKLYCDLCNLVDMFNDIYGTQIFSLINAILIDILITSNYLIIYLTEEWPSTFEIYAIIQFVVLFSWTCTSWFIVTIISSTCNNTVTEAHKTHDICNQYYHSLTASHLIASSRDGKIKKSLFVLSQQVSNRAIELSAADFYPLNNTMLATVGTILLPYIIILIQFNQSMKGNKLSSFSETERS